MVDHFENILQQLKNKRWIGYICVIFLILNGLGSIADNTRKIFQFISDTRTIVTKNRLPDETLIKETILLSHDILRFIFERKRNEPSDVRPDESTVKKELEEKGSALLITNLTETIGYILETQTIFEEKYKPAIESIRDEYLRRGIRDKDIDESIKGGIHDYQLVAYKLLLLSDKLR